MTNIVPLSILVAEDNEMNQKLIATILKKSGYNFKLAQNGVQALEMYQNETFDLVLMDCQMPEMDGFVATEMIRQFEKEKSNHRTPIIALTANAMVGDRERCLKKGMDDFLTKPFRMKDILGLIERWTDSSINLKH